LPENSESSDVVEPYDVEGRARRGYTSGMAARAIEARSRVTGAVDVHLLFPPPWSAFHSVHLSLPLLAGHLRSRGVSAAVSDLNIRTANRLLSREAVLAAARDGAALLQERGDALSAEARDALETALAAAPLVAETIAGAVALLRDPGERISEVPAAAQGLRLASMVVSAPAWPGTYDAVAGSYQPRELALTFALDEALRALGRTELDRVESTLREELLSALAAHPARLYGIGLACSEQLFPALRCAQWIKQAQPGAKVAIGGSAVPFFQGALGLLPRFFDVVDFVVVDDGEEPLEKLFRHVAEGLPLEEVPNVRYRAERKVRVSSKKWSSGFETPAPPDFTSVDAGAYFSRPTLPYVTGRRCYWNKCTFCSITYDKETPYGPTRVEAIVDQMRQITLETGVSQFQFVDEVVPAPRLKRISEAITAAGFECTFDALLRFQEQYEPAIWRAAHRAGMRAVYFGFESGSQKVLDLMQKGTHIPNAEVCLRDAHEAGLYTHCFVMVGFPGEEEADFQETLAFLRRNRESIDSVASGHFSADLCSPCGDHPEAFGLSAHEMAPLTLDHRRPQLERMGMMLERLVRFRAETAAEHWSHLSMGSLNAGNLLARLRAIPLSRFREEQRAIAKDQVERRRLLSSGAHLPVRLSPQALVGAPTGGLGDESDAMRAVYDPRSGAFAILPAPVVALAQGGATLGAIEAALRALGAPAGHTGALLEQRLLVALRPASLPAPGRAW